MKSESFLLGKRHTSRKSSSETESQRDSELIRGMRDEEIILDEEHPEATEEDFKKGVIRHNMKVVRIIK